MLKTIVTRSAFLGIALLLSGLVTPAQEQIAARTSPPATTGLNSNQASVLLSSLPEADTLIYINPQRILNEAAPRVLPDTELQKMRLQFSDLKQAVGVDPARLDYVALVMRSRKPGADLSFLPPEFLVVTSGDFSADSLVTMARLAMQGWTEEKHGSKALTLVTIDEIARQSEKTPFLKSFTRLGLAALSANTIAAGSINYLKAAVDATEGRERINPETLNSLLRDSNALISLAGSPWNVFARSFGLYGTETNPRTPRCEMKLGDLYAAVTMEGTTFKIRGMMNADNPDTARIMTNLLSALLQTAGTVSQDKSAQEVLKVLNIAPQDNEITLQADIPQQMVADFIREQMKPKATTDTKQPASKPRKRKKRRSP